LASETTRGTLNDPCLFPYAMGWSLLTNHTFSVFEQINEISIFNGVGDDRPKAGRLLVFPKSDFLMNFKSQTRPSPNQRDKPSFLT
jgi:hypothetical protein